MSCWSVCWYYRANKDVISSIERDRETRTSLNESNRKDKNREEILRISREDFGFKARLLSFVPERANLTLSFDNDSLRLFQRGLSLNCDGIMESKFTIKQPRKTLDPINSEIDKYCSGRNLPGRIFMKLLSTIRITNNKVNSVHCFDYDYVIVRYVIWITTITDLLSTTVE